MAGGSTCAKRYGGEFREISSPGTWAGTCWTSLDLFFEEEVAKLLGIPYAEVMLACLIPAYKKGTRIPIVAGRWAHRYRHGEGIKRVGRCHRSMGGPLVVSLTSRLEKVPAGGSHDESTSDTHDG